MRQFLENLTKGNSRSVIVKKNIGLSLVIRGMSILVSLALVPLTLGYVSSEVYGIWLTISSIVTWLGFFDIGFTNGLKNKLTEAIALEDWEKGRKLVSTTYFMMAIIFGPLFVLLAIGIPFVNWCSILNIDSKYEIDIVRALYVITLCFCLHMFTHVFVTVVAAYQRVALSSLFPVIGNILSFFVIYILTKTTSPSLYVLSIAISSMPIVVVGIASLIGYQSYFKKVAPKLSLIDKGKIHDLFSLGYKFFIIHIQVIVFYQTTNMLISYISGPNDVTNYNIAYKYISVLMMAFNIFLMPLWPAFTDAFTKRDYSWMNRIYKKLTTIYWGSILLVIIMVLFSPIVYHLWIGDRTEIPWLMTIMVALYVAAHSWMSLHVTLINGVGYIKLQTCVTMLGLFFHIPFAFLLGKAFSMGAYGVITSMIIIEIVYSIVFKVQVNKVLINKEKGIWAS